MHGFQAIRHVAIYNTQRQPFHQRGFADARLAHKQRIVLATARQNIHHLADLNISAEHRIDLAHPGLFCNIRGETFKDRSMRIILSIIRRKRRRICTYIFRQRFASLPLPYRTLFRLLVQ